MPIRPKNADFHQAPAGGWANGQERRITRWSVRYRSNSVGEDAHETARGRLLEPGRARGGGGGIRGAAPLRAHCHRDNYYCHYPGLISPHIYLSRGSTGNLLLPGLAELRDNVFEITTFTSANTWLPV